MKGGLATGKGRVEMKDKGLSDEELKRWAELKEKTTPGHLWS